MGIRKVMNNSNQPEKKVQDFRGQRRVGGLQIIEAFEHRSIHAIHTFGLDFGSAFD
jgi:hypothetical protein